MTLNDIAAGASAVPVPAIGGDTRLTREIQQCLAAAGLLDPPADGIFGAVSHWALAQLLRRIGLADKKAVDAVLARALLAIDDAMPAPSTASVTLAARIAKAMHAQGFWLSRHPQCANIVYVEGMDVDGKPNSDAPNEFNDVRLVLRINRAGRPVVVDAWEATSEPGRYYTLVKKLDPRGAARIAFGQYKAWSVGTHMAGRPSAHEALVQSAPVRVFRDMDANFERTGDAQFEGVFGINQHWGYDLPKADLGRASAGCLVGRTKAGHGQFMALCKADPRYVASNGYRFMTTVMPAGAIPPAP